MTQPRPEHPRPQFVRDSWINLNGKWNFAFDFGESGIEKNWHTDPSDFDKTINVPFCPESSLSGIQHTDFIPAVWYHRKFTTPADWTGKSIYLNFGAVDFDCRVWINGELVGRHYGGSASFSFEISKALKSGENDIVVCALDDTRSSAQAGGKQSPFLMSRGCFYTRVTGIWQTVWLEARPPSHLQSVRIVADLDRERFTLTPTIANARRGMSFRAILLEEGKETSRLQVASESGAAAVLHVPTPARTWSPADPHLYDIKLELLDGEEVVDSVMTYAGLRKFHIEGNCFYLNNKPIFMRLVLDQGFYPDGIWTAPSDAELKADIERSMAVGFNGARLHQKVFEERFHYWADKLGYITWGEYSDWGGARTFGDAQGILNMQREWGEIVMRDLNHPSIVAWTPFNETIRGAKDNRESHRRAIEATAKLTRMLDPTRPVNDSSGYVHVDTDIYTVHDYQQNPESFRESYEALAPDATEGFRINFPEFDTPYAGQPFVVDEYGGTWWNDSMEKEEADQGGKERKVSWGYGKTPESIEEVYHRIEKLTEALTSHPHIAGFTYTQLTDVEQEQNGVYTYERKPKFNAERLKKIFGAPAAIEK